MPFGFFKDVRLSEQDYIENEKERAVPLTVNPFREPPEMTSKKEIERPPEWLELAGDLAWTTSFSSLTSSTTVTEPIGIYNYAVFFALTWHLWATQITYDNKYYTNDWWHRTLFLFQLTIYGLLAGLSSSFNVGWQLSSAAMNPFICESTALIGEAIRENKVNSMARSFRGINFVLFASRILLLLQYIKAILFRWKSRQFWSWRFSLQPLSIFVAAFIFLGCSLMMQDADGNKAVAVTQLTLWGLAIFVQFLAAALTPRDKEDVLKSRSNVAPRLSTLTVIIIGEGLNGVCYTMRHTFNAIGIKPIAVAEAMIVLNIFSLFWNLYFDGFRINRLSSVLLEELWLLSHFPLHLCLIMMFEGIKNIYLFENAVRFVSMVSGAFLDVLRNMPEDGNSELPEHTPLETLLLPLGMSWKQEILDWNQVRQNVTDTDALTAHLLRWFMTGIHNIYLLFNDEPDPEAECKFTDLISKNDTILVQEMEESGGLVIPWEARYQVLMKSSKSWLLPVSGALLLWLAVLNIMQRRPRNRFAWGYSASRAVIGAILIIIQVLTGTSSDSIPPPRTIAAYLYIGALFGIGQFIDMGITRLSVMSIRKKEDKSSPGPDAHSSAGPGGVDTTGDGVIKELLRPDEWSRGGSALTERDAVGASSSLALPYATGRTYSLDGRHDPKASVPGYPIPRS